MGKLFFRDTNSGVFNDKFHPLSAFSSINGKFATSRGIFNTIINKNPQHLFEQFPVSNNFYSVFSITQNLQFISPNFSLLDYLINQLIGKKLLFLQLNLFITISGQKKQPLYQSLHT